MVFFNYSTMQMTAKVVYYGPGLCGKTTNLQTIYDRTTRDSRGEMVSLETETDRTLFFDLLPLEVGSVAGFQTRIQLYTVPGQVFYNTTRKLVLKGVDGVVFVADSQRPMLDANVDSLKNLEENLEEMGLNLNEMPVVLQYNKRDLQEVCSVEEMNEALNQNGWPAFEAAALNGDGVFETLKEISKLTLVSLKKRLTRGEEKEAAATADAKPPPKESPKAAPKKAAPEAPSEPAAPSARSASSKPKAARKSVDVLAELDLLRKKTAKGTARPKSAGGSTNGRAEMERDIQISVDDLERAKRFWLTVQVQDEDADVLEAIQDLEIDIDQVDDPQKIILRLNIALNAKT